MTSLHEDDDQVGETNWSRWASYEDHRRSLELAREADLSQLSQEQLIDAMRALSKDHSVTRWFDYGEQTLERKRHDEIRSILADKYGVHAQICKYFGRYDNTYGVEPFDD